MMKIIKKFERENKRMPGTAADLCLLREDGGGEKKPDTLHQKPGDLLASGEYPAFFTVEFSLPDEPHGYDARQPDLR